MCLRTDEAFLGPAQGLLDLSTRRMIFAPGLTVEQRTFLARHILTAAGQEQPEQACDVVCICGFALDVSPPPAAFLHAQLCGGTVPLKVLDREVVVIVEPTADYGEAWSCVGRLVSGEC